MANNPIQLRVKHKGGQSVVSGLTQSSCVQQLLEELSKCTGVSAGSLKVLRGFPPVPVNVSDRTALLGECGIQERDTVLIEELPETKLAQPIPVEMSDETYVNKEMPTGILMRKVVPSDNSCLFTSIGFCISGNDATFCLS